MTEQKACTLCTKTLPLSLFHKDSRSKDGRRSRCAKCISKMSSEDSKKPPVLDASVREKECPRCKRMNRKSMHSLDDFGLARRRKDGKNSWCRQCCSEASGAWQRTEGGRLRHIEAVRRYNARRRLQSGEPR